MTRNVPHQTLFDSVRSMELWQNITLIISTALTIVSITLNQIALSHPENSFGAYIPVINALSSLFAVAYIALDLRINDRFFAAGKSKRVDLIDHAFNTNFSGERSTGYFNAEGISDGIYKLAVLSFENSLFTCTIAKKMTFNKWACTVIITSIFIFSACIGNKELVNNLLQIAATGVLIQQAVKLQQFANRMGDIHADFKTLFSNLKNGMAKEKSEGEMVRNTLNYEATHSWGNMIMSSKIFNEVNPKLSAKWEKMKQDYNIQ